LRWEESTERSKFCPVCHTKTGALSSLCYAYITSLKVFFKYQNILEIYELSNKYTNNFKYEDFDYKSLLTYLETKPSNICIFKFDISQNITSL
jgi:hypothetical protein